MSELAVVRKKIRIKFDRVFDMVQALLNEPRGAIGVTIVLVIVVCAAFAPWIAPHRPYEQNIMERFEGPSFRHLLGTDYLGRDLFSRLIFGARVAVAVAFGSVAISIFLGTLTGLLAAYSGGVVDQCFLLIFDIIRAFPSIILVLTLVAVVGSSLLNIILVIAFTTFPYYGRIARAQTLATKEEEYISAAESLGVRTRELLLRHFLPNIVTPIIVTGGMDLASYIMWEAGLSFLGLGVQPPTASWGIMLKNGYSYVQSSVWMIVWPSAALAISMLGCSLFAESLQAALNPMERSSHE